MYLLDKKGEDHDTGPANRIRQVAITARFPKTVEDRGFGWEAMNADARPAAGPAGLSTQKPFQLVVA